MASQESSAVGWGAGSAPPRRRAQAGRVGPYEILRELVHAPGATFAEGRDTSGTSWLLQLVRARSAFGEEERVERLRHEKLLAQRTLELVSTGEVAVSAHGGADAEHGERVIFWAFPHSEIELLLERLDERPPQPAELAQLGVELAARLAARHAWGRTDPLLSEHAVRVGAGDKPEVLGIPLTLPVEWLAPSIHVPRLAPEERRTQDRRPSGDLWRLGQLLLALADRLPEPSSALVECFESLAREDPAVRVSSAARAEDVLGRVLAAARRDVPEAPSTGHARAVFASILPDPRSASSWEIPTLAPGTQLPALPVVEREDANARAEAYLRDHGGAIDPEAVTHQAEPATPVPVLSDPAVVVYRGPDATRSAIDPAERAAPPAPERAAPQVSERATPQVSERATPQVSERATPQVSERTTPQVSERTTPQVSERATPEVSERAAPPPEAGSERSAASSEPSAESSEALVPSLEPPRSDAPLGVTAAPDPVIAALAPAGAAVPAGDAGIEAMAAPAPPVLLATTIPSSSDRASDDTLGPEAVRLSTSVPDTLVEAARAVELPTPVFTELAGRVDATERMEPATPARPIPTISLEATLPDATSVAALEARASEKRALEQPIEALAASWQQPVLPSGESPWSEVVQPRGTHHRDRGGFPGFDEDLPISPRSEKRVVFEPAPAPPLERAPAFPEASAPELDPELARELTGFDKRKLISGVLVTLVILGLFALLSRSGRPPDAALRTLSAGPANVVSLDSDPPGATVVSEADGVVLGKTPLRILVAPQAGAAVLLTAPGREPLRLGLPDRGGITARLPRIDGTECAVRLSAPDDLELEGIEADIGANRERRIPGGALVRAKLGQRLRGARVVLCPAQGGAKEQELALSRRTGPVSLRVQAPEGATAYLDGDPIGPIPAIGRSTGAFARLRVDDQSGLTEELWVATPADVEARIVVRPTGPVPSIRPGGEPEIAEGPSDEPGAIVVEDPVPAEVKPDAGQAPAGRAKLTKAQRSARAKRSLEQGTKHLGAGRIAKAKEALGDCVELDPEIAECHRMLGVLYRRARATNKAREHLTRYLELAPGAPDADRIRKLIAP